MAQESLARTLDELVDRSDPGLPLVHAWLAGARAGAELLPCAEQDGADTLLCLQVTTRSPMGALAFASGGLLVDHGWLRILGAGSPRLPRSLASWNRLSRSGDGGQQEPRVPGALLIADDVVGGFFALNGDAFSGKRGSVFYFAPDQLAWEDLGIGYSAFVEWALGGAVAKFYEASRWPGWEEDARALPGDRAFSVYPPLVAKGPPMAERSRRDVPLVELWDLYADGVRHCR